MITVERIFGAALTMVPILLSLSVHEFAHARTALAFGDPTARSRGRCTLNPLAHLDPMGTLAMFLIGFGWARPVPVNPANLSPRRLGDIAVSAAGPLSNLAIAAVCGLILHLLAAAGPTIDQSRGAPLAAIDLAVFVLMYMIFINLALMAFNLLPLFPLDGHHIGRELLPWHRQEPYMRWQIQYGRWVLLGALFLPRLMGPAGASLDILGWYYDRAVFPLLDVILSDRAVALVADVVGKFRGFTPLFR
ncbi:MAG: site-2 protease family protein [Planctomycetes bacterium]|nr:site-2 protease family protein [Planctomycetota bacterium]